MTETYEGADTEDISNAEDMQRGDRARELLDNPVLMEIFDRLEQDYLTAWKSSRLPEVHARERLWQAVQIVGIVRSSLTALVADGELAAAHVKQVAKLKQ